jgi:hypothetical protein
VAAAEVDDAGRGDPLGLPVGGRLERRGRLAVGERRERRQLGAPDRRGVASGVPAKPEAVAAVVARQGVRVGEMGVRIADDVRLVGRGVEVDLELAVGAGALARDVVAAAARVVDPAEAAAGERAADQRAAGERPGAAHQNRHREESPACQTRPLAR